MDQNQKQIHNLQDAMHNEKVRYQQKGIIYLSISVLQVFLFFHYVPDLIQYSWKYFMTLGQCNISLLCVYYSIILILNKFLGKNVYFLVSFFFPLLALALVNLLYAFIYYINHPFFEKYKVLKSLWPWEQSKSEYDNWKKRIILFGFLNYIVIDFIVISIQYFEGCQYINHTLKELPNKFEIIWQIVFFMICDDLFFYLTHRLFHSKYLYKFHKVHHEHHISTSFSIFQVHPIDYLCSNIVSTFSGFLILGERAHFTTFLIWNLFRILESCDGHCGYEFPWSMFRLMPFSGSSDYHNFHHSKNSGNYSSFFTYLDTLFGTNQEYLIYKEQEEKKNDKNSKQQILSKQIF